MTEHTAQPAAAHHVAVHPFVRGLAETDIATLQGMASVAEFSSGEYLFEAGDAAETFYLVRTGVVALELPDAGTATTLQTLQEGSALGWSWLHEPRKWQYSARARTPVRALAFEAPALRKWFVADTAAGFRVMLRLAELMAERLHATRAQLIQLSRSR